jgi:hypothetical protein
VTREQTIVLGFIVAAFAAGWITNALTRLRGRRRGRVDDPRPPGADERFEQAIDKSWRELDRAMRVYHQTVQLALTGRIPPAPVLRPSEPVHEPPLAMAVSEALQSDRANEVMLSAVSVDHDTPLSELELDLNDWGFTYGVAWALARERWPDASDDAIARAALKAAETVFRAYTAGGDPPAMLRIKE